MIGFTSARMASISAMNDASHRLELIEELYYR